MVGGAQTKEAQAGLQWLGGNLKFDWDNPGKMAPIYYWYYATQAKFHAGGEVWKEWNKQFSVPMVKNQTVVAKAIKDDTILVSIMHSNNEIGTIQGLES